MNLFSLGAPSWFWEIINGLWLIICQVIFVCINWFYQVFEKVASVNLFSTEVFKEITSRIYVIMGIAMLFIFAYNLVLMIINPEDKKGSGAMGKVIKETMISLVVVVLLPTIFKYMYIFQSHILETNIIGQIIMGSVGNTTSDRTNCKADDYDCLCDFDKFEELNNYSGYHNGWILKYETNTQADEVAKIKTACETYRDYNDSNVTDSQRGAFSIAPTIFSAFYRPTNFTMEDCENYLINNDTSKINNDKDQKICINYFYDVHMSKYTGDIMPFIKDSYLSAIISDSTDDSMDFNWFLAIICGGLAAWMFICYAMEIGVRVAKLGLLQIISPIAVMMRVIPGQKEKIFDKWFTHLKNTYLDVFIRLVIIYFSLFAISLVPDVLKTLWISTVTQEAASSSTVSGFFIKTLAMVIVIIGILKFAQEAPALIKEFFGDSGRFSLKSPKKQLQDNKLAMGGLGMAGAGAASMLGNLSKGYKKGDGFWKNTGNILKKTPSGIGGLIGGARRGAQQGYGATNFEDLKYGIQRAKSESDAARDKHAATRAKGAIPIHSGKHARPAEVPIVSSVIGGAKETWGDIQKDWKSFSGFITGTESNERAAAGRDVLSKFEATEAQFKNATIVNIENAQQKAVEPYYSGENVHLNGEIYAKDVNGNWTGTTGKDNTVRTHEQMGKYINDHFEDEKRNAFAENYKKNMKALETHMDAAMESLNKNITKMGEQFSKDLFKTLNDPDGLNLNVNNVDQLSDKIGSIMADARTESSTSAESRKILYNINDTLKKQAKGAVGANAPLERKEKDKK